MGSAISSSSLFQIFPASSSGKLKKSSSKKKTFGIATKPSDNTNILHNLTGVKKNISTK